MKAALVRTKRKTAATVVSLLLMVGGVLGISLATAGPAAAADYGVNMTQACQQQHPGSAAAWYWNVADPNSWYCFHTGNGVISIPPSISVIVDGGINVQAWCSRAYPGSTARVNFPYSALYWVCRR